MDEEGEEVRAFGDGPRFAGDAAVEVLSGVPGAACTGQSGDVLPEASFCLVAETVDDGRERHVAALVAGFDFDDVVWGAFFLAGR